MRVRAGHPGWTRLERYRFEAVENRARNVAAPENRARGQRPQESGDGG